jgi:phage I-like protein
MLGGMTHPALAQATALALCFEGAAVPDWVQLTPAGPALPGRDGRVWRLSHPQAILSAFAMARAEGQDVPVDFEHATHLKGEKGEPAPAVGWVAELDLRDGALWGRIEWNEAGHTAIASRAYRYVSPGFRFDPRTLEVSRIVSVGLTNQPNFAMPALNRQADTKESEAMDKDVLQALGLQADATPAQAVVAINALKTAEETALNRAQTPDPEQWVPKADHQLALNRISTFEADAKARAEAEAVAAVDAAIAAGKVAPSSKDYHLATCRAEGGLERFAAMVAAAPVIAGGPTTEKKPETQPGALSADELAVCRQMGMKPEDFAAAKAAEKKE